MMKRLILLALFSLPAFADDTSVALQLCVDQRNKAMNEAIDKAVPLYAEIARLQKRVVELETKEPKK